mmetsp:Transcript_142182/g.201184  ORF Transcript_142182/g.201184 Transcript_142182/m.201184 type:complete len:107 (-) Transcript_142182:23-343(-)
MMALSGDSFCQSAREGYDKIIKNFGDYYVLHNLGDYYTVFGVFFVSCLSTGFGYLILENQCPDLDAANFSIFIALYFLVSLYIAAVFMGVLAYAADCCLFYMTVDK